MLTHRRLFDQFFFKADKLGIIQESNKEFAINFGMVTVCPTSFDSNLFVID